MVKSDRCREAIEWFIRCGDYKTAYDMTNIFDKKEINETKKQFDDNGMSEHPCRKTLALIEDNLKTVKSMFSCKHRSGLISIFCKYVFFNIFYTYYRVFKLSKVFFLITIVLALFNLSYMDETNYEVLIFFWSIFNAFLGIIFLNIDVFGRHKWTKCCELWYKMDVIHKSLKELVPKFVDIKEKDKRKSSLAVLIVFVPLVFTINAFDTWLLMAPVDTYINKVEETSQENANIVKTTEEDSVVNKIVNSYAESSNIKKDLKSNAVKESTDVLTKYYAAIANGDMHNAYMMLSHDMQNKLGAYEKFSSEYSTTLSNEVNDINVISENSNEVILKYTLISKDSLDSEEIKVQKFSGIVNINKENDKWTINKFDVKKEDEWNE